MSSEVVVIWDYQYAWIPEGYDIRTLKGNIEAALKKHNPNFVIQKKLIAIGTAIGDEYQEIMKVPSDIKFSPVPEEYMQCATQGPNCCDSDGVVPCPSDRKERIRRRTGKTMMHVGHETFMKVFSGNNNILIISGDSDIACTINFLRDKGTHMMLARPEISDEGCENIRANVTWLWDSENPQQATMVMGGAPIPPYYTI